MSFWLGYERIDPELQFDWIDGRWRSCWLLQYANPRVFL